MISDNFVIGGAQWWLNQVILLFSRGENISKFLDFVLYWFLNFHLFCLKNFYLASPTVWVVEHQATQVVLTFVLDLKGNAFFPSANKTYTKLVIIVCHLPSLNGFWTHFFLVAQEIYRSPWVVWFQTLFFIFPFFSYELSFFVDKCLFHEKDFLLLFIFLWTCRIIHQIYTISQVWL